MRWRIELWGGLQENESWKPQASRGETNLVAGPGSWPGSGGHSGGQGSVCGRVAMSQAQTGHRVHGGIPAPYRQ